MGSGNEQACDLQVWGCHNDLAKASGGLRMFELRRVWNNTRIAMCSWPWAFPRVSLPSLFSFFVCRIHPIIRSNTEESTGSVCLPLTLEITFYRYLLCCFRWKAEWDHTISQSTAGKGGWEFVQDAETASSWTTFPGTENRKTVLVSPMHPSSGARLLRVAKFLFPCVNEENIIINVLMPKFSFSLYHFYRHLKSSKWVTLFLFIILFIIVSFFFHLIAPEEAG